MLYQSSLNDSNSVDIILSFTDSFCEDSSIWETLSDVNYSIISEYVDFKITYNPNNFLDSMKKFIKLYHIMKVVLCNTISVKSLNIIYLALIDTLNLWLSNNLKNSDFDVICDLLFDFIEQYKSSTDDVYSLEMKYLNSRQDIYSPLIKYFEKLLAKRKISSFSKKKYIYIGK